MKTRIIKCDSSAVDGVRYDVRNANLDIKMKNKGIYRYKNVDAIIFAYFITAPSTGQGYNHFIKGNFKCIKLRRATL